MEDSYDLEYHRAMKAAYEHQAEMVQEMSKHTYNLQVNGADYRLFLNLKRRKGVSTAQMFHILVRNYG